MRYAGIHDICAGNLGLGYDEVLNTSIRSIRYIASWQTYTSPLIRYYDLFGFGLRATAERLAQHRLSSYVVPGSGRGHRDSDHDMR